MPRLAVRVKDHVVRGILARRNIIIRWLGNLQQKLVAGGLGGFSLLLQFLKLRLHRGGFGLDRFALLGILRFADLAGQFILLGTEAVEFLLGADIARPNLERRQC